MNKKVALVNLIEASVLLSDDDKLALIDRVPTLNEKQVDAMGTYLATERQFVLEHRQELTDSFNAMLAELTKPDEKVYVGSGKP